MASITESKKILKEKKQEKYFHKRNKNRFCENANVTGFNLKKSTRRDNKVLIQALDQFEDGVYISDQDYTLFYTSPSLQNVFGPPDNKKCFEYLFERENPCPWCRNQEVFSGKTISWEQSFDFFGKIFYILEAPLYYPDKPIRKMTIYRDITANRQTEEELRKRSLMLESASSIIAMASLDGKMTYANPAFLSAWGFNSLDDVIGYPFSKFWELGERKDEIMNSLQSGNSGRWSGNLKAIRKDGSHFDLKVFASTIYDKEGKPIAMMSISSDITKYKLADDALKKSKNEFRQLSNNMNNGFALHEIVYDKSGKAIDYRFLEMNSFFEKLTGLKAADLIGHMAYESLSGLEPFWLEKYSKVALTGKPIHFENYCESLDKFFGVTAYRPTEGQFACIFSDITARRRTELALSESEQKLSTAMATGSDCILITRLKDGKIIEANEQYLKTFGYSRKDVIGKTTKELGIWTDLNDRSKLIEKLEKHGQVDDMEINISLNDDYQLPFLFSARYISVGGEDCIISIARDISNHKRTEQKLKLTHSNLIQEQVRLNKKNLAMGEILKRIDFEKNLIKNQVQANIKNIVMPLVDILRNNPSSDRDLYFNMLDEALGDITSDFVSKLEMQFSNLSPRELEICNMIKKDLSSKQIANALNISIQTISQRRKHIRKKLGITNKRINLSAYLKTS